MHNPPLQTPHQRPQQRLILRVWEDAVGACVFSSLAMEKGATSSPSTMVAARLARAHLPLRAPLCGPLHALAAAGAARRGWAREAHHRRVGARRPLFPRQREVVVHAWIGRRAHKAEGAHMPGYRLLRNLVGRMHLLVFVTLN